MNYDFRALPLATVSFDIIWPAVQDNDYYRSEASADSSSRTQKNLHLSKLLQQLAHTLHTSLIAFACECESQLVRALHLIAVSLSLH